MKIQKPLENTLKISFRGRHLQTFHSQYRAFLFITAALLLLLLPARRFINSLSLADFIHERRGGKKSFALTHTQSCIFSLSHFFIFMSSLACFPRCSVQSRVRVECRCLFLLRYFSIHLVTYFGSNYTDFRLTRSRL